MIIEQEVRKGAAGNSTVVARADLLRRDVWDRWRAGQGFGPINTPLSEAIGKLPDVADRQLQLIETGNRLCSISLTRQKNPIGRGVRQDH